MIRRVSRRQSAPRRVFQALAIIGIGAGLVYLIQFTEFASVMYEVFSGINLATDAAKNQRGDKVEVGCAARMTVPVRNVGPIQIDYRFDQAVILPDHGYSSFARDAPRHSCP
jgi:hypothetical protein